VKSVIKNAPSNSDWAKLTSQANLFKPTIEPRKANVPTASPGTLYHGSTDNETSVIDPDQVRRFISHQMNLGLSGSKLRAAVLSRYTPQELRQIPEVGKKLASYEGVQGVYFIDPSIYSDLGKGCAIGAKQFRKQGAAYLLASGACTGCMYQTAPAWCSKYCKRIIRKAAADSIKAEVDKLKKQANVPAPSVPAENPITKYELTSELPVDLDGSKSRGINIDIPSRDIDE